MPSAASALPHPPNSRLPTANSFPLIPDPQQLATNDRRPGSASRAWRWACGLYAAALTAGMLWPGAGSITRVAEPAVGGSSRLVHMGAFVVLALLVWRALLPWRGAVVFGVLLVYAVLGEAAQALVPSRTAAWQDAMANALGVALGFGLAWAAARWFRTPAGSPARAEQR